MLNEQRDRVLLEQRERERTERERLLQVSCWQFAASNYNDEKTGVSTQLLLIKN